MVLCSSQQPGGLRSSPGTKTRMSETSSAVAAPPSGQAGDQRSAPGTKSRKSETSSVAAATPKSSHVGRDAKLQTCPKVMFTGVVADHAEKVFDVLRLLTVAFLHCALPGGAVYCNRSCLCVGGSVTTITRNCVHRSSPN